MEKMPGKVFGVDKHKIELLTKVARGHKWANNTVAFKAMEEIIKTVSKILSSFHR